MRSAQSRLAALSVALGAVCAALSVHLPLLERAGVLAGAGGALVALNECAATVAAVRRWPGRPLPHAVPKRTELLLALLPPAGAAGLAFLGVNVAIASSIGGPALVALGGAAAVAAVAVLGLLALPARAGVSWRAPRAPFRRGRRPSRGSTPSRGSRPGR